MPTNASRLQKQNHPRHLNRFLPHNGSPVPSIPPILLEAPAPKSIRAPPPPAAAPSPLAKASRRERDAPLIVSLLDAASSAAAPASSRGVPRSDPTGNSASKCAPNPARPLPRSRQPVQPRNPGRLRGAARKVFDGTPRDGLLAADRSDCFTNDCSEFFLAADHPDCLSRIAQILQEASLCGFRL